MIAIGLVLTVVFWFLHSAAEKVATGYLFGGSMEYYKKCRDISFYFLLACCASGLVALVGFGIFLWRVMP